MEFETMKLTYVAMYPEFRTEISEFLKASLCGKIKS